MHSPVCKFPRLWPTDVHVLCTYDDDNKVNTIHAYTSAEARSSSGCYSSLDAVDSPLAQHQMSVVPLVGSPVAISIFLHSEELSAHKFFKLRNFHSSCRKLGYVKSR